MFVVTSLHTKSFEPLAEWTLYKNKKRYCEKHGYTLYYVTDGGNEVSGLKLIAGDLPVPEDHTPMGWGKIYLMKDAMEKYPEAEWIFNADCDTMITNMEIKLENIVAAHTHPNTHIIVPSDCNGINCGIMMIRNSPIGKAFLNTIIAGEPFYRYCGMFENQLIQDMLLGQWLWMGEKTPGGSFWSDASSVPRQRVMNSYDYKNLPLLKDKSDYNDIYGENGEWKEGDFMIQWPATTMEYRINAAKEMFAKLKYDE